MAPWGGDVGGTGGELEWLCPPPHPLQLGARPVVPQGMGMGMGWGCSGMGWGRVGGLCSAL